MGVDVDLAQDPPVASIPPGKIAKIKKYLDEVLDAKLGASKDLRFWEELLGVLNWISSVLVSGRFHLAQVVSARRAAAKYKGMIVTKGLQSECQWWWNVVTRWNRVAILLPPKHVVSPFSLADSPATDAAGGAGGGGGGFFAGLWTAVKFSAYEVANLDIMELEAMTYCIFLKMLIDRDPHLVMGRRFLARNDNQPWVAACNGNDSSKPAIAVLLAWLHELMALYSFVAVLEWIPSAKNVGPDALSRGDRRRFLQAASDSGFPPSSLVFLQMPRRTSLVSKMISAKNSARSMHQAR
jgi:hypothetical protein